MKVEHSTRLILLRHGETDWNAQHRFQGQADVPLNGRGRIQAAAAAEALSGLHFAAVYSSPLARALDTARLVAGEVAVSTDPRLQEINVGTWAGRTWRDIVEEMPDYEHLYANGVDFRRSPTGETLADVVRRGVPAVLEIAERHPGEVVLIVAHGLLLNRVLHGILGLHGRVLGGLGNAHFSELGYAHGAWRLVSHNVNP